MMLQRAAQTGDGGPRRYRRGGDRFEDLRVDGSDEVERRGEEACEDGRVVVVGVERDPCHGSPFTGCGLGQERGLAIPGRCRNGNDGGSRGSKSFQKGLTRETPGAHRGRKGLGLHPNGGDAGQARSTRFGAGVGRDLYAPRASSPSSFRALSARPDILPLIVKSTTAGCARTMRDLRHGRSPRSDHGALA